MVIDLTYDNLPKSLPCDSLCLTTYPRVQHTIGHHLCFFLPCMMQMHVMKEPVGDWLLTQRCPEGDILRDKDKDKAFFLLIPNDL